MKRTLAIASLSVLLAVPVLAEINDDAHDTLPKQWLVSEEALNARVAQVESAFSERVAKLESELNQRVAKLETDFNQRVAKVESTLNERVATLQREIQDLRASAEPKERQTRLELGEQNGASASPEARRPSENGLTSVTQRTTEIEKTLAELLVKVKEMRARLQQYQARAETKGLQARGVER